MYDPTGSDPPPDLETLIADYSFLVRAYTAQEAMIYEDLFDLGEPSDTLPSTAGLERTGRELQAKAEQVARARLVVESIAEQASRPVRDHYVGELAYLDTGSRFVLCKVIGLSAPDAAGQAPAVRIRITAPGGGHSAGEVLTQPAAAVVPRGGDYTFNHSYRLRGNYRWAEGGDDDAHGR